MLKKLLFIYVFLFAYAGAILHSIVPHHHHASHKEAQDHHHHDTESSHSHQDDKQGAEDHGQSGSLYFLTHASNSDILFGHAAEQGVVKSKKAEKLVAVYNLFPVLSIGPAQQIFHPPTDDLVPTISHYLFRALRAPPLSIA
jgi:hypothetical protein